MLTEKMKQFSYPLYIVSKVALLLAVYGAFTKSDIWLAPTQWLLVAILSLLYALYYR